MTIFQKIINKEIPAEIIYQDELVTAFVDIAPKAPVHILIVPNKAIATLNDATKNDELVLGRMMLTAKQIAHNLGIAKDGYRVIMNCNEHGGQEVFHIHLHLLGGKKLGSLLGEFSE